MGRLKWRFHEESVEERSLELAKWVDAKGEFLAALDHLKIYDAHPNELPRRKALRTIAVALLDACLYVVFTGPDDRLLVMLHITSTAKKDNRFSSMISSFSPVGSNEPCPELPAAAWDLAEARLATAGL